MNRITTKQFDTKVINWKGPSGDKRDECYILVQNENGPCPLVALVNTLILRGWLDPSNESNASFTHYVYGKDSVTVDAILERLANRLANGLAESSHVESSVDSAPDSVLSLLPELITGLNVNPNFDGSFEDGPSVKIFEYFGIQLLHGWLSSAHDEEVSSVLNKVKSYDEAQTFLLKAQEPQTDDGTKTEALILQEFLDTNSTQLTQEGLKYLQSRLEPGVPQVLFRNDHFSTICKAKVKEKAREIEDGLERQEELLFLLVTDSGYKKEASLVWESLTSVSGATDSFYDGDFQQVDLESLEQPRANKSSSTGASSAGGSSGGQDDNDDFYLARKLQEEEDSRMASRMHKRYGEQRSQSQIQNQNQQDRSGERSGGSGQGQEQGRKAKSAAGTKKKAKKSPSCIIS